jgi:hypothetical protein
MAERSKKYHEGSAVREDGVVFRSETKGKPPRLRPLRWLRDILLVTQPPLLAVMQGGEYRSVQLIHRFYVCPCSTARGESC